MMQKTPCRFHFDFLLPGSAASAAWLSPAVAAAAAAAGLRRRVLPAASSSPSAGPCRMSENTTRCQRPTQHSRCELILCATPANTLQPSNCAPHPLSQPSPLTSSAATASGSDPLPSPAAAPAAVAASRSSCCCPEKPNSLTRVMSTR